MASSSIPRGPNLPNIQTETDELVDALNRFGYEEVDDEVPINADDDEEGSNLANGIEDITLQPGKKPNAARQPRKKTRLDKKLRGLLRSTIHTVTSSKFKDERHDIRSWKMADYAYKRDPCPFPTRARGLFTESFVVGDEEAEVDVERHFRIVARGYDKFFNVGEVAWTRWDAIPRHSSPPYELTLKSNGCIILICALNPSELLVTSKHSMGSLTGVEVTHAQKGEEWLEKHLAKVGRTKEGLAALLWKSGWTAVAELCDDSFEEHVLPYPEDQSGLHLHGINMNHPTLYTLPAPKVSKFALEWGFLPTRYLIMNSVDEVKSFTDECGKTGKWNGEDVEGFVVRGVIKQRLGVEGPAGTKEKTSDANVEPPDGFIEPFFWKVKFDEPYLMYREWRELTRKLLAHRKKVRDGKGIKTAEDQNPVNPNKLRRPESKLYFRWVDTMISENPETFEDWDKGRGVVRVRDEFLRWRDSEQGKRELADVESGERKERAELETKKKAFDRTLLVPIAVPGCGKTLLAIALTHLFGFGHIQSDDIPGKKAAKVFVEKVTGLLKENSVVIADKNNHLDQHRRALAHVAKALSPSHSLRLVALFFDTASLTKDEVFKICIDRIENRGENHQTLRPDSAETHRNVLSMFLSQVEEFDPAFNGDSDGRFDEVIKIPIDASFEDTLELIVRELCGILGLDRPDEGRIREAIDKAGGYKAKIRRENDAKAKETNANKADAELKSEESVAVAGGGTSGKKKKKKPRYYGVSVELDLEQHLQKFFSANPKLDSTFFDTLRTNERVEKIPHITLVHEKECVEGSPDLERATGAWEHFKSIADEGGETQSVEVTLGPRLVWDGRAMSIQVSGLTPTETFEHHFRTERRVYAHITVGTVDKEVKPIEGKWIMERLVAQEAGVDWDNEAAKGKGRGAAQQGELKETSGHEIQVALMEEVKVKGKIKGLY